jgi:predicted dienelactone hydrolase
VRCIQPARVSRRRNRVTRRWLGWFIFLIVFSVRAAQADDVGFSVVSVPNPPSDALQVGIWYPATATASEHDVGLFTQVVAPDATVSGGSHPLIVMSHGNGGTFEGHYDTALALAHAGFVVAAVTHTGDNYRDQSQATHLVPRPQGLHTVIDYMLTAWPGHSSIDSAKVGAFGFSAGGFTVLVSIGGIPDLSRVPPYCATHGATFVCKLLAAHPIPLDGKVSDTDWIADPRIKAAVIAAPAIGFTFTRQGLKNVRIPVQLWRAGDDTILPSPDYAEAVRDALPRPPEYHVVAGADHFDFLAPCSDALTHVAPMICQEHGGFNRAAFHRTFNRDVVRFFSRNLRP